MILDEEIDRTKLRYVLYARRSTTDEGSQVRSVPDQIKYCKKYAEGKLNIVKIVKEKGSAKKPNKKIRPKFYDILEEIENGGKYDAILSYAPDRLSRNMLDGGRIINLLDEGKNKRPAISNSPLYERPVRETYTWNYVLYFQAFL